MSDPSTAGRSRRGSAIAVAWLALYAAFVAWLTWPLARSLGTALPLTVDACRTDPLQLAWTLSYETHRLVTAPAALPDANIFHPTPRAFFYGEGAYGALPYFLPVFLATGNPVLALNLVFLGGVTLTAWGIHLLVRHWSGSQLGGLVAASTFLFTRWVLWIWFPIYPTYAVIHYLPLLMLWTAGPALRAHGALRVLPLLVLQGLVAAYMAAAAVGIATLLALGWLVPRSTRRRGAALLAVAGVAAVILVVPYAGQMQLRRADPEITRRTWWPTARQEQTVLPWGTFSQRTPTGVPSAAFALIAGGAACALARRARGTGTAWWQGIAWALGGLLLSFTPVAMWGDTPVRMPQDLLTGWLPVYELLREPSRLGIVALIGIAVLAGVAFTALVDAVPVRAPRAAAAGRGILLALVLWTFYVQYTTGRGMPAMPPFTPTRLPPAYRLQPLGPPAPDILRVLRQGRGPLLELPVPAALGAEGGAPHARAVFHSIYHWRPVLNGYASYWPAGFHERMDVARRLPDPRAVDALQRATGLELVLVHVNELPDAAGATWRALADAGGRPDLRLVAADDGDLLFALGTPADARGGRRGSNE